jgi:5-methylcytosine-specific restriction protein A
MVKAATVVDHIIPHQGDMTLFWDADSNWQSLCKTCHDRKTATEDGGFGRARSGSPIVKSN